MALYNLLNKLIFNIDTQTDLHSIGLTGADAIWVNTVAEESKVYFLISVAQTDDIHFWTLLLEGIWSDGAACLHNVVLSPVT